MRGMGKIILRIFLVVMVQAILLALPAGISLANSPIPPANEMSSANTISSSNAISSSTTGTYPERIVSIAPSNTEILFALGLGDRIVGVTDYCNYPEEAKDKPKVGGFKNPSIETIVSLNPDIVFATSGVQMEAVENLRKLNITVYQLNVGSMDDILTEIQNVGEITGKSNEASLLVSGLRSRIKAVEEKTRVLPESEKPKVYMEIWTYWTVGRNTFAYDLIKKAGGKNTFDIEQSWFLTNAENVISANPDVILLAYHGMYVDPVEIKARDGFESINAVKSNRIYNIDSDAVVREGPRLVDSLEEIALILHPGLMNTFRVEPTTLSLKGDLGSFVSGEIIVANTGISETQLDITSDISSGYGISFSPNKFSLARGKSKSITASLFIPKDEEIKTKLLGTVRLSGKDYSSSLLLYLSPNNNLKIDDINVYLNGKREIDIGKDGGRMDNAAPGSAIKIEVKMLNDYPKDVRIEEISVAGRFFINGEELEDESSEFSLNPQKSKTAELSFDIPLNAEEDDYEIEITAEGKDKNNVKYSSSAKLRIEVEKEKNRVIIEKAKIPEPSSSACWNKRREDEEEKEDEEGKANKDGTDERITEGTTNKRGGEGGEEGKEEEGNIQNTRNIQFYSRITNIGKNDEDVRLLLSNSELGIYIEKNFRIEKDSSIEVNLPLNLPNLLSLDKASKNYPLEAVVFYKDGEKTDKKVIDLNMLTILDTSTRMCTEIGLDEQLNEKESNKKDSNKESGNLNPNPINPNLRISKRDSKEGITGRAIQPIGDTSANKDGSDLGASPKKRFTLYLLSGTFAVILVLVVSALILVSLLKKRGWR